LLREAVLARIPTFDVEDPGILWDPNADDFYGVIFLHGLPAQLTVAHAFSVCCVTSALVTPHLRGAHRSRSLSAAR